MNAPLRQALAVPGMAELRPAAALLPAGHGRRRWPVLALLILAMVLLSTPWDGLNGDAKLYAVQALRRLHPANFQQDLFFLFGSQDSYSVFSPLYAAAIDTFGVHGAALLLQVAGSALWLGAAALLLASFLHGYHYWLGLALLVLLPSDYGPLPLGFALREHLLTPRLYGEALGILALALAVRGHLRWGVLALLLAVLLHPLMAAGALLAGLLFLARRHGRAAAVALLAGLLALGAAALLDIAPVNRIWHSMDSLWLARVAEMAPMVTWDAWHAAHWASRTAVAFSLLVTAGMLADGWRAHFFRCLAATGALGLLATWLGTGVFHNVLLIQVQPWRALWLVQLGSVIALAWLLATFWQRGRVFRVLLLGLLVATLARNTIGGVLAALAGLAMWHQLRRPAPLALDRRQYRLCLAMVLAAGTVWAAELVESISASMLAAKFSSASPLQTLVRDLHQGGFAAMLAAAVLLLAWRLVSEAGRARSVLAWAVACSCIGASGFWSWSHAQSEARMSEAAQRAVRNAFLPLIPQDAVVYWENDVRASWFLLQRSSYVSSGQLAGLAFNRGTAMEGQRRLARMEKLGVTDSVRTHDRTDYAQRVAQLPRPSVAGLEYVCQDPVLDFVILSAPLASHGVAQVADPAFDKTYYLHDCARLRAKLAAN